MLLPAYWIGGARTGGRTSPACEALLWPHAVRTHSSTLLSGDCPATGPVRRPPARRVSERLDPRPDSGDGWAEAQAAMARRCRAEAAHLLRRRRRGVDSKSV